MSGRGSITPAFRSNFESRLAERLDEEGIKYEYEKRAYRIQLDTGLACDKCGERQYRPSRYTPDFFFPVWVVEAKGKFTARDRKRVVALLEVLETEASPGREYTPFAMLFQRDNFIRKGSKTRYSDWCKGKGIPYAVGWFKEEWLT